MTNDSDILLCLGSMEKVLGGKQDMEDWLCRKAYTFNASSIKRGNKITGFGGFIEQGKGAYRFGPHKIKRIHCKKVVSVVS